MIIDKHQQLGIAKNNEIAALDKAVKPAPDQNKPNPEDDDFENLDKNALIEVYKATKRVLSKITVDPKDPKSAPLFQTIKIDNGQFERIVRNKINEEVGVAFPAAFIRFVNVRYLVAQQRIGEGRATMRIRFILNNLNNSDDDVETMGFEVFQRINKAIQKAKDHEPALNERCNLEYFDMPQSQNDGLQPFWVDYEIWFRDYSGFEQQDYVDVYVVMPPFTNHSDAPEHDIHGHGDHHVPIEDVTDIDDGR